jgi:APA family basic amino acid/polyamine antiporter
VTAPHAHHHHHQLLRILGVAFGIAVTLGNMIGAGILRTPSAIAASVGSATIILLLWLAGALHTTLSANIEAELGTALPLVGGPYVFSRRALGDVAGLIVGWSLWGAKLAGIAAAAVSFANFFAILVPAAQSHQTGIAIAIQVIIFGANILGLREGRELQKTTSFLKAVLLLFFALAAVFVTPAGTPAPVSMPAALTWVGIIGAYKLIRGAYSGWDAAIYFTEESNAPAKTLPKSLFVGLAVASFLYLAVNAALLHALGVAGVASSALPFMSVLQSAAGASASVLFAVGAMITVLSVVNANVMTAPRILFALSRDRLLPHALSEVNDGGSPYIAMLMTGVGSIALAATGKFVLVFGLIGTLNTVAALLTVIAFFALRRREPALARPFRAFGYPVLPALALAIEGALLILFNATDRDGFLAAVVLSAACVPFAWIARRKALDKRVPDETP